jgi:hypothetical protein
MGKIRIGILLTCLYGAYLLVWRSDILTTRFDSTLLDRYAHSQDITHEVSDRIFLSDSDIYLATGYLYASGSDPAKNNFEHPPVMKYLFGWSARLTGNPLLVQVIMGYCLLMLVYCWGLRMTKQPWVGALAALLLLIDPLYRATLGEALLDLGQTVFLLSYLYVLFYRPQAWFWQGILLALFAGTKFWITPWFFGGLLTPYYLARRELRPFLLLHLAWSLGIYTLFYAQSFRLTEGHFNLLWHMAKTVKYHLVHNTTAYPGASLLMYLSSYWQSWWGSHDLLRSPIWSPLWPLGLLVTIHTFWQKLRRYDLTPGLFIAIVPLAYLLFLGVEAPFPRYFLIILPFVYLTLAIVILDLVNRHSHVAK